MWFEYDPETHTVQFTHTTYRAEVPQPAAQSRDEPGDLRPRTTPSRTSRCADALIETIPDPTGAFYVHLQNRYGNPSDRPPRDKDERVILVMSITKAIAKDVAGALSGSSSRCGRARFRRTCRCVDAMPTPARRVRFPSRGRPRSGGPRHPGASGIGPPTPASAPRRRRSRPARPPRHPDPAARFSPARSAIVRVSNAATTESSRRHHDRLLAIERDDVQVVGGGDVAQQPHVGRAVEHRRERSILLRGNQ